MLLVKEKDGSLDELFEKAIKESVHYGVVSAGFIQRRLSVGYIRAARILDQLEYAGIVSSANGSEPRRVLILNKKTSPKTVAKLDTRNFLWDNAQLITNLLDAHGITVRLVRVTIQKENILFLFDFAVGTKIDDILKLDKEIASILASPTGKVEMGAPFKGTCLLFIFLPIKKRRKEETYRAFDIDVQAIKPSLVHKYKSKLRETLMSISAFIGDLAYKV